MLGSDPYDTQTLMSHLSVAARLVRWRVCNGFHIITNSNMSSLQLSRPRLLWETFEGLHDL